MPRPLHIEVIAKIKRQLDALALQFIHDSAVVNPLNRNLLAVLFIKQPPPLLCESW